MQRFVSIDCLINGVCVWFIFKFSQKYYDLTCFPCILGCKAVFGIAHLSSIGAKKFITMTRNIGTDDTLSNQLLPIDVDIWDFDNEAESTYYTN